MPRRQDGGSLEALHDAAALLPWWANVLLALAIFGVLHRLAAVGLPTHAGPAQLGLAFGKGLALIGQFLIPLVVLRAAVISARRRRERKGLLGGIAGDTSGRALRSLGWREFELLAGETFRRRGFSVMETGGGRADGGVDLKLTRDGETFFVQCKQWRAYKVSVNVVRELLGVMVAHGAAGGFVVTSGVFTKEAREFARGSNVELLDGKALASMIGEERLARVGVAPAVRAATPAQPLVTAPACPVCGRGMVRRVARRGVNAGGAFWGCSRFPDCRGRRPIE